MFRSRSALAVGLVALLVLGLVGAAGAVGAGASPKDPSLSVSDPDSESDANVSEEAYVEPAPEADDPYYEASDGNWVSYVNPRDEYRSPYLGDGSGKIGVVLLNEAGEPIVGESVPNTTVTIPTGETTSWHSHADPLTVQYPLTEHYDRPLDGDQFGTTDDLPQGDGYMDTHSIELHGHPENATIEYGEAQIEGEHADKIEVVGYVQQAHDTWDTSVDPIEDAVSYEEAGGEWTYEPGGSHGEVMVVLQLDADETGVNDGNSSDDGNSNESTDDAGESTNTDDGDGGDELPGFGVPAVLVALAAVALVGFRRRST